MQEKIKRTTDIVKAQVESQVALYDEDSDQLFQFDPESQKRAWGAYEMLGKAEIVRSMMIHEIKENKYYLVYGFSSFDAFRLSRNMGKMTAVRHAKIGELLSGNKENSEQNSEQEVPKWDFSDSLAEKLDQLGLTRGYEISRLGKEKAIAILNGSAIEMNDEYLDLSEAGNLPISDLAKKITRMKSDPKTESASALKAEIAKVNAEKKILKRERDDALKQAQRGQQLEDKYGATNATVQGKIRDLNLAHQSFSDFLRYVNKADIRPDDPEVLVDLLETLTGSFMTYYEENIDRLKAIVYQARGDMPFDDGEVE